MKKYYISKVFKDTRDYILENIFTALSRCATFLFCDVLHSTYFAMLLQKKNHASFVPLIDFLGKVEKNSMGKILSMSLDEVLESQVALFLILVVSERHFQSVIQCLHSLYTLGITLAITCLREAEKDSEALLNGTSIKDNAG